MIEATVTATEMKNNFGKYMQMIMNGNEVVITRNGEEVGRLIPKDTIVSSLTDSLTGILHQQYDLNDIRDKDIASKYGFMD